jgi:hypothetical protein
VPPLFRQCAQTQEDQAQSQEEQAKGQAQAGGQAQAQEGQALTTKHVVAQVTTRGVQRQQEEEEEASCFTCLDVGADHHKQFKGTCSDFCDKFEGLEPHMKTDKTRHTQKYWCIVKGHDMDALLKQPRVGLISIIPLK